MSDGSERLSRAVVAWRARQVGGAVEQRPGCVYGLITREQVEDLTAELGRVRGSLENLSRLLVGLLLSVLLALLGVLLRGAG